MRILVFLTLFFLFTIPAWAQDYNASFVDGLWYSSDTVFVEEPVRIYAALRNNTGSDLSGTVEFFVGTKLLERMEVNALEGRVIEAWADWTPTYGEHQLSARLKNVRLHTVGSTPHSVEVTADLAEEMIFVDYDTDEDGIGNEEDADDDGDGINDADDEEPLIYNEPPPESNETDSEDYDDTTETSTNQTSATEDDGDGNQPQGLEQFLVESRAESALSQVTDVITNTKQRLDTYRSSRNTGSSNQEEAAEVSVSQTASSSASASSSLTSSTSTPRIGEITRTQSNEGTGLFGGIFSLVKALINTGYTFVLFILSIYLAHPAFVQLTLLFLILFIIFKLARRMARRPQ